MTNILKLSQLSFAYDRHNKVLNNVNCEVNEGEFTVLIGPNGSGKSTLLKLILNSLQPQSGVIELLGSPISEATSYQNIAYVAQNVGLQYTGFVANVEELVAAGCYNDRKNLNERITEVLSLVGMENYRKQLISNLSGGQMQRIAIAKALITNPQVLILDEPTAGVDKESAYHLYQLLKNLSDFQQLTILMVTHDLAGCFDQVDRILCLENRSICELSRLEAKNEIMHRHHHPEEL